MTTFASLWGQEAAMSALRRALEGDCLPGAYLFVGATGVGKGALAQAFAQAATCLEPRRQPFDSCGQCDSCRRAETNAHPEILLISPAGDQLQIWQFWDRENRPPGALSHTLPFAPGIGKRRIYLIEQADRMNESAANSLLKVLEEPPPYVVFVLLAPHPARVLPTIVSRCQMIRLNPMPLERLETALQDRFSLDRERAGLLAAYAEGRVGQAVQMAQNPAVSDEITRVLDFAEELPVAPQVRALRVAERMRKLATQMKALLGAEPSEGDDKDAETDASSAKERAGRRQFAVLFDLLGVFYRDLLAVSVSSGQSASLVNRERAATLQRLAQQGTPERWMRCLDTLLLARRRLDANANIALVTESLAITLLSK